jgi:hypothetical protein
MVSDEACAADGMYSLFWSCFVPSKMAFASGMTHGCMRPFSLALTGLMLEWLSVYLGRGLEKSAYPLVFCIHSRANGCHKTIIPIISSIHFPQEYCFTHYSSFL